MQSAAAAALQRLLTEAVRPAHTEWFSAHSADYLGNSVTLPASTEERPERHGTAGTSRNPPTSPSIVMAGPAPSLWPVCVVRLRWRLSPIVMAGPAPSLWPVCVVRLRWRLSPARGPSNVGSVLCCRQCNASSTSHDGCKSMCCGRPYNTFTVERIERCQCKYVWCCDVKCKTCKRWEDVHECT